MPNQEEIDLNNPEQHFAWALHNLPMIAGVGAITHPGYLAGWSGHLWKCGFRHVDWLKELADEDGNIHVSKLPEQLVEHRPPFRGQRHPMNNAARWARPGDPEPEPTRLPNIHQLTQQENAAMLKQYYEAGMIPDPRQGPPMAEVVDE